MDNKKILKDIKIIKKKQVIEYYKYFNNLVSRNYNLYRGNDAAKYFMEKLEGKD